VLPNGEDVDRTGSLCEIPRIHEETTGVPQMVMKKRRFPPGVEPQELISLREFLPYRIHLLSSKIARPADVKLADGKVIRARDWRVILQLASRGPLTNRELSSMVGLDAANITRVVQYLSDLGLVTTRSSAVDRRKQIISLTAEGAAVHDEIAPKRKRIGEDLLKCLTTAERVQLFQMLDRLEEHLEDDISDEDWIE
jgi:DNA-binding MarR family transcriptional regulator